MLPLLDPMLLSQPVLRPLPVPLLFPTMLIILSLKVLALLHQLNKMLAAMVNTEIKVGVGIGQVVRVQVDIRRKGIQIRGGREWTVKIPIEEVELVGENIEVMDPVE